MFEILKTEEPNLCHSVLGRNLNTNNEMPSRAIFVDSSFDYCEEMGYESDSALIQADIENNIEDSLLGLNFMKPDTDHLQYLTDVSTYKSNEVKSDDVDNDHSIYIESGTQDEVIVEEVAEQEIISDSVDWPQVNDEICICGCRFSERSLLLDHLLDHSDIITYQCHKCNDVFHKKKTLIDHMRSHESFELMQLISNEDNNCHSDILNNTMKENFNNLKTCKGKCLSAFKQKMNANQQEKLTPCNQYLEDTVQLQLPSKQYKKSNFQCSYCRQVFSNRKFLLAHIRTDHAVYRDGFICIYCGKRCKDFRGFQKHSTMHFNGELLSCKTCDKHFCTRTRLKRHMLSHREGEVVCDKCGEKMVDHRALARHRSSHHVTSSWNGALTTRTFPCYNCNKVFGSKSSQQIHMRIHTGERPYSCKYCVKAFADGGTLRKHERIHTGEKPYVCPICPKAFNQRVVLREHIRAHHAGSNAITEKPLKCEVCYATCNSSQELCSHLVKHSDENTAKHRSPIKKPRKYKKWKKHQMESKNKTYSQNTLISNNKEEIRGIIYKEGDITSHLILTDEECLSDNNCENESVPCTLEQSNDAVTEFQGIKIYFEDRDNCLPFTNEADLQKWKVENGELADDLDVNCPLLSPLNVKLHEKCVAVTDSCEAGYNSDDYLNQNNVNCKGKNGMLFAMKKKNEFLYDSDFLIDSGLGLGATVELQSEF